MFTVSLKQLENICHEEGKYISFLRQDIANQSDYLKDIQLIKLFETGFRIPDDILDLMLHQGCQLYFEFPLREEKEHSNFFNKLYRLPPDSKAIPKEFAAFRNILLKTYRNVLHNEQAAAVVFEMAYMNKAANYLQEKQHQEDGDLISKEILFMSKIIEVLLSIRKELLQQYPLPTAFFSRFVDAFPYAHIIRRRLADFSELFLAKGFPLTLFKEMHASILAHLSNRQVGDIVNEINARTLLTKDDLKRCNFSRFVFPQEEELLTLLKTIRRRAEKSEIELVKNDKELALMDQRVSEQTKRMVKEKGQAIVEVIESKNKKPLLESSYRISEVLSEIEKTCLDYIWHLKDFFDKSYHLSQKIEANHSLKSLEKAEFEKMLADDIYPAKEELIRLSLEFIRIKPFLEMDQSKISRNIIQRTIQLYTQAEQGAIPNHVKIRKILSTFHGDVKRKFMPNVPKLIAAYQKAGNEILLPLTIAGLLQRNIREWKQESQKPVAPSHLFNEANYFGMYAIPKGKFFHFSKSGKIRTTEDSLDTSTYDKIADICAKQFKKVVSVLIYDIRGSSFMTLKLHNAEREQMIIKNFHATMAKIAKEYGAFLLKDTGDGGIIWFGNNSKDLYDSIYRESTTKRFKKLRHSLLSEEGLFLQSAAGSSEKAISCAISMVKAAEKFIKDNYVKYRDWFSEIKEKELIVEGTTYALLPPMFRSLFRLGIGIASGIPSRDVAIGPNAFGDPDLRGMLVNEAKILSEGRDPEKSVILIDHGTVFNMLFNSSKFTYGNIDLEMDQKTDMMVRVAEIVKAKLRGGSLNFTGRKFTAHTHEILFLESLSRKPYTPIGFRIDDNGVLLNEQGEKVKILYSVTIE
jgi:hypothetical protein